MREVRVSQRRRPVLVWLAVAGAFLLAACSSGGQGGASSGATPTPLPTPVVPEKPIYTVEQGTVVNTLEFTGRVSPVLEQELFFKSDGFVADVFFGRGDQVAEGDLLAELEIGDLQNRLAQQHRRCSGGDVHKRQFLQSVGTLDQQFAAAGGVGDHQRSAFPCPGGDIGPCQAS